MIDDKRHNIPIIIDYRIAYTVIKGLQAWLDKLVEILDEGVRKSGKDIPCRRTTDKDRRNKKDFHKSNVGSWP